ncbi:MAG: hypothetical protein OEZ06_24650 [Myxococcales bacterium]|nr:hypothetical protein [Myxococcales bacterium]
MHQVSEQSYIHPSAEVEEGAQLGAGCQIWHQAQVRRGAVLGARCEVGKGAFIDRGVRVGAASKIQNYACLYAGVELGDGVFVGPMVSSTNDLRPRAVDPLLRPLDASQWEVVSTQVGQGASIGANATIVCGVRIGAWAMVGAGAVVTGTFLPMPWRRAIQRER